MQGIYYLCQQPNQNTVDFKERGEKENVADRSFLWLTSDTN